MTTPSNARRFTLRKALLASTAEGDPSGTGMQNFDAKFEAGRSFRDTTSPRYDRKAKYLSLYQIVNDRNLDPRVTQVKGKDGGQIVNPFLDPGKAVKAKPPM